MQGSQPEDTEEIITALAHLRKDLTLEYVLIRCADGYYIKVHLQETGEAVESPDITPDPITAAKIFSAVVRGKVTPCCILEVLEDMIESI